MQKDSKNIKCRTQLFQFLAKSEQTYKKPLKIINIREIYRDGELTIYDKRTIGWTSQNFVVTLLIEILLITILCLQIYCIFKTKKCIIKRPPGRRKIKRKYCASIIKCMSERKKNNIIFCYTALY